MHHFPGIVFLYGLFLISLTACATIIPFHYTSPGTNPEALHVGDIVNTKTGKIVPFEELVNGLSESRIIYAGETHTSTEDHKIQLKLAEALYAKNPHVIVAMEMFPKQDQAVLDRYTQGLISEEDFLKDSDWDKVWGYPFELYRGILTFARDKHLRVIGLNIPPGIAHKISRSGIDSLTPAERSEVAQHINFNDPEHRRYILEQFEQHSKDTIKGFNTFYEAQLAWEETMAETLAHTAASFKDSEQVLVIIGNGHINYRFGVPQRAWDRTHFPYKTLMPLPVDYPDSMIDPKLADYVWVTGKHEKSSRGQLGIMIRSLASGEGVEVLALVPDGPAAKAGIQKGDILYKIDGVQINAIDDLHRTIAKNKRVHELSVKRGNRHISVTVFMQH